MPGGIFNRNDPTKWTDEDFKRAFNLYDRDRDGTITRGEVCTVMKTLGQEPTEPELENLMGEVG